MEWTWDPEKNYENRRQHRSSFETARLVGEFILLANSPRSEDANCYDNVHSWQGWPLPEYEEC